MHSPYLSTVMQKLGEAEVARAVAKSAPHAPRPDTPHRRQRFLRVPRISAKGLTRRPAGNTAVRSA
jgi:hypothetical protein